MKLPDAAPQDRLDRVTRLARRMFGVPTAHLCLHGAAQPDLEFLCADIMARKELVVLEDAGAAQGVGPRFQAGCPVAVDGAVVGALCLADTSARVFDAEDRALLCDLAAVAASELAAAARQAALEQAQAAEQQRRDYFRTAAHELRTPMASILGFSELLLKREFDAATGRELLGIIHTQSTRLVGVINQLLDLARIEAGGPDERQCATLALSGLVQDALAAALPAARREQAELAIAPALPCVAGNAPRLAQALANILANAARFSAPGSRITVTASAAARDGRPGASVAIRDHGIGMTAAQQARMFEAFYRAGENPAMEGVGLGLALARAILDLHGGAIDVASRSGAGTTVTVWLPAAQDAA